MEELEKKAKAYDDVKEKIALRFGSNVVEEIFSEYEMNEDERIRKAIIDILNEIVVELNYKEFLNISYNIKDMVAWLEKQGEQKFADKVEPNFKIGDILVSDEEDRRHIYKVEAITNYDTYILLDLEDRYTRNESVYTSDLAMHLWTIQDAKDGDVLVDVYGNIGIYQRHDDFDWKSYWSLGCYGGFQPFIVEYEIEGTCPATKEQRDLLFQKMKEAGYELDAVNKELKKISQRMISAEAKEAMYDKPACVWSEEDEHRANDTIYFLDTARKHYASTVELDACIDWLKSLKNRVTWKPSEEQMEALTLAIHDVHEMWYKKHLLSLKQQLKQV